MMNRISFTSCVLCVWTTFSARIRVFGKRFVLERLVSVQSRCRKINNNNNEMSNIFVTKAREQFFEYATLWIEFMVETFPTCTETQDCKIFLTSVVKNSEAQMIEQLDSWFDSMQTPLNTRKTKYAKAIERITGTPAIIYHALAYKDTNALRENLDCDIVTRVKLIEKYETSTEDIKETILKFLDKITHAAYEAKRQKTPQVPTRADIQDNIKQRREKPEEAPSMTRAFQTHINAMCRQLNDPAPLENADDAKIRSWMSRWNAVANATTEGSKNSTLCSQKDVRVLQRLSEAFSEIPGLADVEKVTESVWKNIHQLNGFSAVTESIPTKMMGRIEDMASRLADDIVAGRTDMASVNLSDIGQQVLSGCDEEDMNKFAGNIDALLPALQNFHGHGMKS